MSKRLFGTDGIRGKAGEPPLDRATAGRFGRALAEVLTETDPGHTEVLLARDTRESGLWLRDAVSDGLRAGGLQPVDIGILPTPGLAWLTESGRAAAGVMISASHNPFEDNGLKVFGREGMKIPDRLEKIIEDHILDPETQDPATGAETPFLDEDAAHRYVAHLSSALAGDHGLKGVKLVLDAGNGAAATWAPEIYRSFGIEVTAIGCAPNGRNINLDCGSLHLDSLAERVRAENADIGLAFDGDADRCLAVDARGRAVDGDYTLYLLARHLKRKNELTGDTVVATIMSNLWLEQEFAAEGIRLLRAQVGDKYVLEMMLEQQGVLGGEQSGHIIYRRAATTGDGMLTGLLLLRSLVDEGRSLADVRDSIQPCPQLLINIAVREKPDLRTHPTIGPQVSRVEQALEGTGRVILRYSGTEKKARVMVEGPDPDLIRDLAGSLVRSIEDSLGV